MTPSEARGLGFPISGPHGSIWFAGSHKLDPDRWSTAIDRVLPSGHRRKYRLGVRPAFLHSAATGNGFIWFGLVGIGANRDSTIDRISVPTNHGVEREFTLGQDCGSEVMAAKGRSVYFGEYCEHETPSGDTSYRSGIVRIGSSGKMRRYPLPAGYAPEALAVGPEGAVWFGATGPYSSASRIGRIRPSGDLVEYRVPDAMPTTIAVGRGGRLWFPSSFGGQNFSALRSIDTKGDLGEPICIDPTCQLQPYSLATSGPDGSLWYSASAAVSFGGGGGSHLIQAEDIANEAGMIGHLSPP